MLLWELISYVLIEIHVCVCIKLYVHVCMSAHTCIHMRTEKHTHRRIHRVCIHTECSSKESDTAIHRKRFLPTCCVVAGAGGLLCCYENCAGSFWLPMFVPMIVGNHVTVCGGCCLCVYMTKAVLLGVRAM